MKKIACLWVICAVAVMGSGCASVGYFKDRAQDAADIFTLTVGMGLGVKARVGPVRTGLLLSHADVMGLRGGEFFYYPNVDTEFGIESYLPAPLPHLLNAVDYSWWGSVEIEIWVGEHDRRKKVWIYNDSDHWTSLFLANTERVGVWGVEPPYYAQIEVVVGLIPSVRAGFNPGELLDFFLGWFGIDIYSDDIAAGHTPKDG